MLGTKGLRLAARALRPRLPRPSPRPLQASRSCSNHAASSSTTSTVSSSSPSPPRRDNSPPDHRQLGLQQELFTTSIYSPGSPIFLPRGALIFNRLVEFLRQYYVKYGFQEVITPTIYKKALWAKSGHLENYADDMFTVTSTSPARRDPVTDPDNNTQGVEEDEYGLKPMNCPGHCLIFAAQHHSYRDLPIRYADFSPLHRNEISGALSGLTRVRRFHQDDGHIFCMSSQIEQEIKSSLEFVKEVYDKLNLGPYRLVLSTRPEEHYIGTLQEWDQAEDALKAALDRVGQEWTLNQGDGAFYGPKIDIILRDSDGKEHQTATIQLDFQLPKRFDLEYDIPAPAKEDADAVSEPATTSNEKSTTLPVVARARPVMIHRAVLGSVERLMALLIEHYNGKWPFWLSPRQILIITVNDTEPVLAMARECKQFLQRPDPAQSSDKNYVAEASCLTRLSVDIDESARPLGRKALEARQKGYSVILTIGPKNVKNSNVDVELCGVTVNRTYAANNKGSDRLSDLKPELYRALCEYR